MHYDTIVTTIRANTDGSDEYLVP